MVLMCRPHSILPVPDQRPARGSSPGAAGRAQYDLRRALDCVLPVTVLNAGSVGGILAGAAVVLTYAFFLGRLFRRYRGDMFIEWALMTTMLLVVSAELRRFPGIPEWVGSALWPLLGLSCLLSIFF
jgi:hypothetical protein